MTDEVEKKTNMSDRLGELHYELDKAMVERRFDDAKKIRIQITDLMDDGKENDSTEEFDFSDDFVDQWYNEGW